MTKAVIGTWKMAYAGVKKALDMLHAQEPLHEAIIQAIQDVEQCEAFISVGHGGLPNEEGGVQLDAAYMNGNTLGFGGVIEVENIQSPIAVAYQLSKAKYNCLLSGKGGEEYALKAKFPIQYHLSEHAKKRWLQELSKQHPLRSYEGHDTVCVIGLKDDEMAVGVSTSGLFMKHKGRVGDSPIIGSGFYSDAQYGSAAATGLGEDIMRGCLSIRIVDRLASGIKVQEAVDRVLDEHIDRMQKAGRECDAMSVIAMDANGHFAASTNLPLFPYVVANDDGTHIYFASYNDGKHDNYIADQTMLQHYDGD